MSSACVCHTEEWCFYCEVHRPLEEERDTLKLNVQFLESGRNNLIFIQDELIRQHNDMERSRDYWKKEALELTEKVALLQEKLIMAGAEGADV